jgi:hypothetical protein
LAPVRFVVILAVGLSLVGAAAGCGGESGDLFAVDRSGDIPGAKLRLIVDDGGTVTCNTAKPKALPAKLLLQARAIATDIEESAQHSLSLAPGPQSVLQYVVHTRDGTVRFADDSHGQPEVTQRLAYFTRQTAQQVCGLAR